MPKINTLNLNNIDYDIEDATARESISKLGKLPFIEITEVAGRDITAQVAEDTPSGTGRIPSGTLVGYKLNDGLTIQDNAWYSVQGLASQGILYLQNVGTGHGAITGTHKGVAVFRNESYLDILC